MSQYGNLSADSPVRAYEIGNTYIIVEFRTGTRYLYDHERPGPLIVAKMKALAIAGEGLGTFISKTVKKSYARKVT
jgi:hypothetical protein